MTVNIIEFLGGVTANVAVKTGSQRPWEELFFTGPCGMHVCLYPPRGWLVGIPALLCNYGSFPTCSALL